MSGAVTGRQRVAPADRPALLLTTEMSPSNFDRISAQFELLPAFGEAERMRVARAEGGRIRGIICRGMIPITAALLDLLPRVEIICSSGVGYEGVDLSAAAARGLPVTHGRGVNVDCVADQAMALLLAVLRQVPVQDRRVRRAETRDISHPLPQATGLRVGLVGFGNIGQRIARRCAGFEMSVRYFSRNPVAGEEHRYVPDLLDLARQSEALIVSAPGGAATRHLIDAAVLTALGPEGILVNVGRGSTVDTGALMTFLRNGQLAGAGLDVFETEPVPLPEMVDEHRLVLSPHIGGQSPTASLRANLLLLDNLQAHFGGAPLLTPIPGYTPDQGATVLRA